ncbi:MAG: hypothetical protein JSV80_05255 [Acidobacteriota bacterium]|nr:MAG: hypothetical protein JSV80_05255 [Acidobacteriota bacterium]
MTRVTLLVMVAMLAAPVLAWNPLVRRSNGSLRRDTASAVVWNPDGGTLGKLSNAAAVQMVVDEIGKWQAVPIAVISYAQGGQIIDPDTGSPTDVTSANYNDVMNADNGQNPIIFDNDRDIFDLLGEPSGVLGFAGVLRASGTTITKGYAVFLR